MNRTAPLHPILVCPLLAVLAVIPAGLRAAEATTEQSADDGTPCQLNVNGAYVERLELTSKTGRVFEFEHPGSSVTLSEGQYRVRRVVLKGGFAGFGQPIEEDNWFTLAPDRPHELKVGAPLTLSVEATRRGSRLTLDYALRDASGRRYIATQSPDLPAFTVYNGDEKAGSGSFEYG